MREGDRVELYLNQRRGKDDPYIVGNFIKFADERGELGIIAKISHGELEGHKEFEFKFFALDKILVTR